MHLVVGDVRAVGYPCPTVLRRSSHRGIVLTYIAESKIARIDGCNVGYVIFTERMEVMSSAILNGGDTEASAFFIMQVDKNYDDADPGSYAAKIRDALNLPADSVGMMTAAEVDHVFNVVDVEYGGHGVTAIATAGLSNHVVAGEELLDWDRRHMISMMRALRLCGTINIAVVSDVPLTSAAKVNMMAPLVEAKTVAMNRRGYNETGTTSDSMAVISPIGGPRIDYTGTGTDIGIAVARAVRKAVGRALETRNEHPVPDPAAEVLQRHGYDPASLYELSGCDIPIDRFIEVMTEVLEDETVEVMVDIIGAVSCRADSMAADGNPEVYGLISAFVGSVTGNVPDGNDCIGILVDGIISMIGRKIDG